jgi:hypothetical protein
MEAGNPFHLDTGDSLGKIYRVYSLKKAETYKTCIQGYCLPQIILYLGGFQSQIRNSVTP